MDAEPALDKHALRRSFERAAESYDAHAVLQREVCNRMLSRLDFIKLEPVAILDAGCGTGNAVVPLRQRYGASTLWLLDLAWSMVERARARLPWWRRVLGARMAALCGDIESLPIRAHSVDLVWSNLALQWATDTRRACGEFRRVLAPGGLLMFSTFGPDTLKELRDAYRGVDEHVHVNRFLDMHDIGDVLVSCGYADPVMDMEYMTLTYSDVRALMRDLKAIGAHNVNHGRNHGLSTRATLAAVERNYERLRRDGRLPATFEVIYGHAWAPLARTMPDGRPVIPIRLGK